MYEGIYDPGMGTCRPRVTPASLFSSPSQSAIGRRGWGFLTVRGGFDPEDHRFRSEVVGVVNLCTIPCQSSTGQRGWGFHTVRGGFDPGDHRFRLQVVRFVDVWRDF